MSGVTTKPFGEPCIAWAPCVTTLRSRWQTGNLTQMGRSNLSLLRPILTGAASPPTRYLLPRFFPASLRFARQAPS